MSFPNCGLGKEDTVSLGNKLSQFSKMAERMKALTAARAWRPEFDPQNSSKGGEEKNCPQITLGPPHVLCGMCPSIQ